MKKRSLGKSLKVMVVCAESWICIWGANAEVHSKAVTHAFYWNCCEGQNAGLEGPWPWQHCWLQSAHLLACSNDVMLCPACEEHICPGKITVSTGLEPFPETELECLPMWTQSRIFIVL